MSMKSTQGRALHRELETGSSCSLDEVLRLVKLDANACRLKNAEGNMAAHVVPYLPPTVLLLSS